MASAFPKPYPQSCCYLGVGVVHLAPWDAWQQSWGYGFGQSFGMADALQSLGSADSLFRDVGEASRLDIDVQTRINTLRRYDGRGGSGAETEQLDKINLVLNLDCLDWDNLALAFAATRTELSDELPGDSWGFDYGANFGMQTSSHGLRLARFAMLTQLARKPMAVVFDGINAIDGRGVKVFIPKVKLHLAPKRQLITDDMAELSLSGTILHAGDRGEGFSPWWDEIYTS